MAGERAMAEAWIQLGRLCSARRRGPDVPVGARQGEEREQQRKREVSEEEEEEEGEEGERRAREMDSKGNVRKRERSER